MVSFPWSYFRNHKTYGVVTAFGVIVYILILCCLNYLDDNVYVVKIDKRLSAALDMPLTKPTRKVYMPPKPGKSYLIHLVRQQQKTAKNVPPRNNPKLTVTERPKAPPVPPPKDKPGHLVPEQPKPAQVPKHEPIHRVPQLPKAAAAASPPKNKPANLVTELVKAAQPPLDSQPVLTVIEQLDPKSKPKDVKPSAPKVEPYDYKNHPGCDKCSKVDFLVYTVLTPGDYKQRLALRKEFQDSFEESTSMLVFIAEQSSNQDILQEANKFGDIITMPANFNKNQFDLFAFKWIQSCCVSLDMIAKINGNVEGILDKVLNMGDRVIQGEVKFGSKIYCEKKTQEFKTVITKETYNQNLLERHCSSDKGVYLSMEVVQKLLSVQNENNNKGKS